MSEVEGTDGRVLADRYRLGAVLGKGGMGTVWRAVDETLGRTVAVKELRFPGNVDEDEKRRMVTRMLREAKATARIRNTGAITVFDVVKEDDRPWIVMELVEGRSLSDAIREDGPLTPKRAAEIGLVLLDVLKAAHKEGILHRDVKPSNVLIAAGGPSQDGVSGGSRVVLSDFGIAQIDGDPSVTSTGMLVGAPSYISPERARGQKPGPPADLWSLGALLYAAVEGRPPYDKGSAIATLTAVMTEPVGPMANAGPLAGVIKGLLAKDPAQRLDDEGARALLTAVAYAPDRPAAPPAPPADARTAVLAVDPPPTYGGGTPTTYGGGSPTAFGGGSPTTPTDALPAAAGTAADLARARDALRAVRRAADRTGSVPEPGTPADPPSPPPASLTDVMPRRTLVIVVAAVVLALLGTVIGVAIANSGGGKGDKGGKGNGGGSKAAVSPSAPVTPSASTPSGRTDEAAGDDTDGPGGTPSASGAASTAGTNGPSAPTSPAAGTGADAVPRGFRRVRDPEGFSIAVPRTWRQASPAQNHYGHGTLFIGPPGSELLIDWTHDPGPSALAKWQQDSATVGPTMDGYQRLGVAKVRYRTYDAADWEYKRQLQGKSVHVLNRGMVTDAEHGYALLITFPAGAWDSAANQLNRQTFFATFKPAK